MERANIIKKFLSAGYQLNNDSLDMLENVEDIEGIIRKMPKDAPAIIDASYLGFLLKGEMSKSSVPSKITPEDCSELFKRRFEFLRNVISKRQDIGNVISINRISPSSSCVTSQVLV